MKYLVTGGAGFIGSNIVDRIIKEGNSVVVYDNFSTGKIKFIEHHLKNKKFTLVKASVLNKKKLNQAMKGVDFVFHLAAHADVRSGYEDHFVDHRENLEATQCVLEAMIENNVKQIAFSSTSSVYGDAIIHPTPEEHPLFPTSLYGSTKAAAEHYIHAYASYYDLKVYIFRFVSFVGERYTHGIVYDVMKKLKRNCKILPLLSDGTPRKSSVYVGDGVDAIFTVIKKSKKRINVVNIGNDEIVRIDDIINFITDELKINVKKQYEGGVRGWKGDNNFVHLDNKKLKKYGWKPKLKIEEGIRRTVRYINDNFIKLV